MSPIVGTGFAFPRLQFNLNAGFCLPYLDVCTTGCREASLLGTPPGALGGTDWLWFGRANMLWNNFSNSVFVSDQSLRSKHIHIKTWSPCDGRPFPNWTPLSRLDQTRLSQYVHLSFNLDCIVYSHREVISEGDNLSSSDMARFQFQASVLETQFYLSEYPQ